MKPSLTAADKLKNYAMWIAGVVAMWGMFVMGWCTIRQTYIDVPMLLVLSNIVTGIMSCITTILVGRTIAQLNQQSDVSNKPFSDNTSTTTPDPA